MVRCSDLHPFGEQTYFAAQCTYVSGGDHVGTEFSHCLGEGGIRNCGLGDDLLYECNVRVPIEYQAPNSSLLTGSCHKILTTEKNSNTTIRFPPLYEKTIPSSRIETSIMSYPTSITSNKITSVTLVATLWALSTTTSLAFVVPNNNNGPRASITTQRAASSSSTTPRRNSNQLVSDLMQIEWIEQNVQELEQLEQSAASTTSTTTSDDSISRSMDYELAEAISEPRLDPAVVQRRIQARLQQRQQALQEGKAETTKSASQQLDAELTDAISEPRVDPAVLQQRLQARLARAQARRNKAPVVTTKASSKVPKQVVQVEVEEPDEVFLSDRELTEAISEPYPMDLKVLKAKRLNQQS